MAEKIWLFEFKIRTVSGQPFPTPQEMHRIDEALIATRMKDTAEKIAERFDFAYVEVIAKDTSTGKTRRYIHQADEGLRSEWQAGRQ